VSDREVLLVAHTGREETRRAAHAAASRIAAAGLTVRVLREEAAETGLDSAPDLDGRLRVVPCDDDAALGAEVVLVLGGDGTLLRAAELARAGDVPLIGVNLGHVGFLAEAEASDLDGTVDRLLQKAYEEQPRLCLDVTVRRDGQVLARGWALNEVTVEKGARERMLEVVAEVDGRPLSRWGCDGVVCATPTGSTAYSFSAGGPVVWPGVEALLMVPISAHALFARPLVVAPGSTLALEVLAGPGAVLCADGRRTERLEPGSRVEVRRSPRALRLARISPSAFTDRLVAKFELPVQGWRGSRE
jgi:NAD+ kinase